MFGAAGNRIVEYDAATGALIREYVWMNGRPIAVIEGGVLTFIRTDHIGRTTTGTPASDHLRHLIRRYQLREIGA